MTTVAITGHTRGLGQRIYQILRDNNVHVRGFSLSGGVDLRDFTQRIAMANEIQTFDWFVNCAKPDYVQSQILYNLFAAQFQGKILSIGSPVVHKDHGWTDLGLLEYVTQKTALFHAHTTLSRLYPGRLILWEPDHVDDVDRIRTGLADTGIIV